MNNDTVSIRIVDNTFIKDNWFYLESLIESSFSKSTFNADFSFIDVLNEIKQYGNYEDNHHIVATKNEQIIGCVFSIKSNPNTDEIYHDLGWFFIIPEISRKERILVVHDIIEKTHFMLRNLKYKYIQTEIGTKEGAMLLEKRFNYIQISSTHWNKKL